MRSLKLGITGGIGAGKSVVCQILRVLNFPIFDSDSEARLLMNSNEELKQSICEQFGVNTYDSNGILNRSILSEKVFGDNDALRTLNNLVHPFAFARFEQWAKEQKSTPLVFAESAILFESGFFNAMDKSVLIYAPEDIRIKRVMKRDHAPISTVKQRIAAQLDEEEKKLLADFVIYNDEQRLVIPQILQIIGQLS